MSKNNISFILHKPQLSENIGACARAIKNFSFKKLILINPKPIFPNDKIFATSVGAKNIINQSKVYENIEKALKDIDIVIATSARFRNKNIKHINLDYANYTLQIPTNPEFKSLNLSHSLIIITQLVSSIIKMRTKPFQKSKKVKPASKKEIQSMINLCLSNLEDINFFKPKEKKPVMLQNLRNIFYKMELSDKETRILSSVFASLGKKR